MIIKNGTADLIGELSASAAKEERCARILTVIRLTGKQESPSIGASLHHFGARFFVVKFSAVAALDKIEHGAVMGPQRRLPLVSPRCHRRASKADN